MERRSRALLHQLVNAMNSTGDADVQYFIQRTAPVILKQLDNAQALRKSL